MSDAFTGEIRIFPSPGMQNEPPQGWMFCLGQELNISNYQQLYSLIGTRFGGNGVSTFKLPDLRGRTPIGQGPGPSLTPRTLGQTGGAPTVAINAGQLPAHTHSVMAATGNATADKPGSAMLLAGSGSDTTVYARVDSGDQQTPFAFDPNAVSCSGGGQQHSNVMPSLGVNFIICFEGLYPQRP